MYLVFVISGSREYSEDSLKLACDYQGALDASFGGTEILQPLQAIYNKPPMTTHSRQVIGKCKCMEVNLLCLILNRTLIHEFIQRCLIK